MDVQISRTDHLTKATLDGRLDSGAVDRIELQFTAGIVPHGKHVIVDLTNVTFLGSLGVRMFIATARSLKGRGATMALFGAVPTVMEIIDNTGLTDIILVLPTEAEAIAAIGL